jgi:ADP-ribose pyrophosphatase YjhB (NUDIX family)
MKIIEWARKVQAVAQSGLHFTQDPFDRQRYGQLQELVAQILSTELEVPTATARSFWSGDKGYATPKIDARGCVFEAGKVLLVRERSDGLWTCPGGWVDVNDRPATAVEREIYEESGYRAKALKLAALWDKNNPEHGHKPDVVHIYKLFFLCGLTGGEPRTSEETDAVDFFPIDALPPLSLGRTTASQVARLHRHYLQPDLPTEFD